MRSFRHRMTATILASLGFALGVTGTVYSLSGGEDVESEKSNATGDSCITLRTRLFLPYVGADSAVTSNNQSLEAQPTPDRDGFVFTKIEDEVKKEEVVAANPIFCTSSTTPTATPSATPTKTSTPLATQSGTPPTATNSPTVTNTPTPTATLAPGQTPSATPTPTNSPTVTNTPTPSPTGQATATNTPVTPGTNTPTNTATNTPIPPTSTNTPTPPVCPTGPDNHYTISSSLPASLAKPTEFWIDNMDVVVGCPVIFDIKISSSPTAVISAKILVLVMGNDGVNGNLQLISGDANNGTWRYTWIPLAGSTGSFGFALTIKNGSTEQQPEFDPNTPETVYPAGETHMTFSTPF